MNSILLQVSDDTAFAFMAAFFMMMLPVFLVTAAIAIVSHWIIYRKAGKEGWECIVPIYSAIVLLKIVGKPWWWIFLYLIPVLNIIWLIWTMNMLSKSFGKDEGFTVGLLLLGIVFFPIMAFSKNIVYQGPFGDKQAYQDYQNKKSSFDFEKSQVPA